MEKSIDFYPNEECSIAREGEGLGDGRAVFTGMLRTGSREGIHFMAGIMVYAFYDPMSRNCSGLDSHPQLITRMGDGADVLRVPLHVMPGSMPLAERFLTDGRLRISGPDPKGVYFGGRGKKAYFNWLDSGGDAASPCKDPQFTLGAGLSAEAQAVLYNTYWFRKLLGSDMPELPHFAVYWEGIYLPRAALPRIANLDSLGLRAPYPEGKEPWERPLRYDPWADRPASSRRARKAPPGGTAAAKARPHAAAGGTAAAKARPYAAAGGTAAAKARPYAAAAGTAAAKGGPYAPSAATAAAKGGPYAPSAATAGAQEPPELLDAKGGPYAPSAATAGAQGHPQPREASVGPDAAPDGTSGAQGPPDLLAAAGGPDAAPDVKPVGEGSRTDSAGKPSPKSPRGHGRRTPQAGNGAARSPGTLKPASRPD